MAGCERGYLCVVCGEDVEEITDSVLYLRYVLGEVDWNDLDRAAERHIRCDPVLAQFIVCDSFDPVKVDGIFSKAGLDTDFVRNRRSTDYEWFSQAARSGVGQRADCRLSFSRRPWRQDVGESAEH